MNFGIPENDISFYDACSKGMLKFRIALINPCGLGMFLDIIC